MGCNQKQIQLNESYSKGWKNGKIGPNQTPGSTSLVQPTLKKTPSVPKREVGTAEGAVKSAQE